MAIREKFAIRASIDQSAMDMVMNPSASSMFSTRHEFTVKSVISMGVALIFLVVLVGHTGLSDSGTLGFILWIPSYLVLVWLLCGPTDTHELGASYLPTIYKYFVDNTRYVSTRTVADSSNFIDITQLKGITPQGKIIFRDNSVGYGFEVVGNASILMFHEDRLRVLEDVRNFYRNINPTVTLTFDTALSGQRVVDQLNGKDYQLRNLPNDPHFASLRRMLQAEQLKLRDDVGKKYKALHQYLIVRGPQDDDVEQFIEWLNAQVVSNSLLLKSYRKLSKDELIRYFKGLYTMSED